MRANPIPDLHRRPSLTILYVLLALLCCEIFASSKKATSLPSPSFFPLLAIFPSIPTRRTLKDNMPILWAFPYMSLAEQMRFRTSWALGEEFLGQVSDIAKILQEISVSSETGPFGNAYLQGDHSGCTLGVVDLKTKVAFKNKEHICTETEPLF